MYRLKTKHLRVLLFTLMVFPHDQLIKYLDMICSIGRGKFSFSVGIALASRDWWIHEALKWLGWPGFGLNLRQKMELVDLQPLIGRNGRCYMVDPMFTIKINQWCRKMHVPMILWSFDLRSTQMFLWSYDPVTYDLLRYIGDSHFLPLGKVAASLRLLGPF